MVWIKIRFDRSLGSLSSQRYQLSEDLCPLNRPVYRANRGGWNPEADLYETPEAFVLVLDVAGVRKEDFEVSVCREVLRVQGVRNPSGSRGDRVRYHHLEIGHGFFDRTFQIPAPVDDNRIEAHYTDGILTVTMAKGSGSGSFHVPIQVPPEEEKGC